MEFNARHIVFSWSLITFCSLVFSFTLSQCEIDLFSN